MIAPRPDSLDERLSAAFARVDTRPNFEARLMARLAAESQADEAASTSRAHQRERERYRAALERASWRREMRSLMRLLSLETVGSVGLIVMVLLAAWAQWGPVIGREIGPQLTDELRENARLLLTSLAGIFLGLSPLLASALRTRSPSERVAG